MTYLQRYAPSPSRQDQLAGFGFSLKPPRRVRKFLRKAVKVLPFAAGAAFLFPGAAPMLARSLVKGGGAALRLVRGRRVPTPVERAEQGLLGWGLSPRLASGVASAVASAAPSTVQRVVQKFREAQAAQAAQAAAQAQAGASRPYSEPEGGGGGGGGGEATPVPLEQEVAEGGAAPQGASLLLPGLILGGLLLASRFGGGRKGGGRPRRRRKGA